MFAIFRTWIRIFAPFWVILIVLYIGFNIAMNCVNAPDSFMNLVGLLAIIGLVVALLGALSWVTDRFRRLS